jgi:hypothetical protein
MGEALRIFKLAQFAGCIDVDLRIAADAKASAALQIGFGGKNAVAEIGFGDSGKDPSPRRFPPSRRISVSLVCVAWIRHQRPSTATLSNSHSTGRFPLQAIQSSTSRICSAT